MRKRASSLLDKPGGMGATGRERGSVGAGVDDRLRGAEATPPSECSGSSCCDSVQESEPCWVVSRVLRLNGVTVTDGPPSTKEVEKIDTPDLRLVSLRLRRTNRMAPITRRLAATPPATAPAIAPVCDGAAGCFLAPVVPLAFIVKTGALKEGELSDMKQSRDCFARTSGLMART